MTEPRLCERTVGRIGISQLANHLRLGSCVRKHVDKVNHDNIKRQILNMVKFLKELLACGGVVELVVGVLLLAPESVELGLYQLALMNVEPFVFIFVNPQVREHCGYLQRHQAGENGVSRILGGGGKNCGVKLLLHAKPFRKQGLHHLPLVKTEIIYKDEADFLSVVEQREDAALENLMAHERMIVGLHPAFIFPFHKLAEIAVGVTLLHEQQLAHGSVGVGQFKLPIHKLAIHLHPVLHSGGHVYVRRNLLKLLLIARRGLGRYKFAAVKILFERQQNLVRIHRLYKIVGNLVPYGLVHQVLLLRFGNHYHRHLRMSLVDARQRLKPRQSRHILIKENEIESVMVKRVERVTPVGNGGDVISFVL